MQLVDAGLGMEALPVLALWEHVATMVTRSVQATLLARCGAASSGTCCLIRLALLIWQMCCLIRLALAPLA